MMAELKRTEGEREEMRTGDKTMRRTEEQRTYRKEREIGTVCDHRRAIDGFNMAH